ncbi:hypothetical protein Tco_0800078 [Tanacetum coccineum]|uniref:Uncharacterized protein n=1 Tax=Tanacetum coccineum TaxID=301880 RepID=A0ABQ4ZT42_9ASTR
MTNSGPLPIQGTKPLFKMAGSQCRIFRGDRLRVMQAVDQRVMLMDRGVIFDEEQLAFLVDQEDRVKSGPDTQTIPTIAIFQPNNLDAFDSDCDEAPSASAVFMAKLSAYDLDVLFEVHNYNTYQENNTIDQSVQEMQYSEQPIFVDDTNIEITSDSNVISYEQYL